MGVSIEKGRQGSSWEDCQQMCGQLSNCSAWTFHETSPLSCDFFSYLESIDTTDFSVTGQLKCQDPSAVMVNAGNNERDLGTEKNCIMKGVKIMGVKLKKKRQEFIIKSFICFYTL